MSDKNKPPPKAGCTTEGEIISDKEKALWYLAVQDVLPLDKTRKREPLAPKLPPKPEKKAAPYTVPKPQVKTINPAHSRASSSQLDGNTERRFQRGLIPIDAQLDLHGHTQISAQTLFESFLQAAHRKRHRCVLVITGKGRGGEGGGILRRQLPVWADLPANKPLIVKISEAAARHGGTGAYYIYLRRERGAPQEP